jgi:glycosyltransferase involved in cell wall biosynthesis/GT2 family glycosyltransferase
MTTEGNGRTGLERDISVTTEHHRHRSDAAEHRMVFVLEQALGHVSHGRNIERVVAEAPGIAPSVIRVEHRPQNLASRLPLISTWSFEASWAARESLRTRLAQGPVDAMLFHTQVTSLFSVREMRDVPTVISMDSTPVNYDDFAYDHTRQGAALEWAKWRMNRRAFDAARAVVAWSKWTADSVVDDYHVPEGKVRVVPPGIDLARFRPGSERRPNDRLRVLFVGGDFSRKGGETLVEAMKSLDGEVELDVVTGVRPPSISTASSTRVHLGLDHASDELFELFRRADVFVLPTIGETYGLVLCEAMACGLPIVATNVGAIPEIVEDGRSGVLVPPNSPSALADALRMLARRPDLRRSMGERGLHLAHRDHDATRNIESVLELMTDLSRSERAPSRRWSKKSGGPAPQPSHGVDTRNEETREDEMCCAGAEHFDTAVVVCTRNRPADLRRCLASLAAAPLPGCRVVVVDQSDGMDTAAVFEELVGGLAGFDYVASGRIGASIARNQGARSARGGLVLFTDDDCEVTADWVDNWRRFFEAHPTVGIAFGKVDVPEFDPMAGHIPSFDPGRQDRVWGPEVFWRGAGFVGMGANMAVRHDAFDVVGGFDEVLGPGARLIAGEDHDLALRMVEAGYRLGQSARPTVTHHGFRNKTEASRLGKQYGAGTAAMYLKHVRCRDFRAARFMARDVWRLLARIVRSGVTGKRPTGLNSLRGFVAAIPAAANCPVDVNRRVYTSAEPSMSRSLAKVAR